jgi:hypothetical protein
VEDRYWKWMIGDRTACVYRLIKGKFEKYGLENGWEISDQYERAVQDPEFPDITKKEADTLIGELILKNKLGEDNLLWPKHCLIEYPTRFESQIDLVAQAVEAAPNNPKFARELVSSVDADSMKRWVIDVAFHSGIWRAKRSGVKDVRNETSNRGKPPSEKELNDLFARDNWRCRYCGIRVGGRLHHFKQFGNMIDMPELYGGDTDEAKHGIHLMLKASHDHVKPVNQGGGNDQENLVTACFACQFGKWKYSLEELRIDAGSLEQKRGPHGNWRGLAPTAVRDQLKV